MSNNSILRLVSGNEPIVICATVGANITASATDVFSWFLYPDFKNCDAQAAGEPTPDTSVEVYERVKDGDFKTIFGSLGRNLDELCLTQEQIIAFVRDHEKWLRTDGYTTFFLLKVGGEFFVARMRHARDSGLKADVVNFPYEDKWCGPDHHRVVVPQTLES